MIAGKTRAVYEGWSELTTKITMGRGRGLDDDDEGNVWTNHPNEMSKGAGLLG
jgi:hypothetical protein